MTSTSIYSANPVTQSKTCNKCNTNKPLTDFTKHKRTKDGFQARCRACTKEYDREYNQANKKLRRDYNQANKEHSKEYRERTKDMRREYQKANRGPINAQASKRRATKLNATPKWAELELISQLHDECSLISKSTGIEHHIDHIVPLMSDKVCGLHCIANLQILSAFENRSKSNSYWPDM